jgi:hypothetical protein
VGAEINSEIEAAAAEKRMGISSTLDSTSAEGVDEGVSDKAASGAAG